MLSLYVHCIRHRPNTQLTLHAGQQTRRWRLPRHTALTYSEQSEVTTATESSERMSLVLPGRLRRCRARWYRRCLWWCWQRVDHVILARRRWRSSVRAVDWTNTVRRTGRLI